MPDPTELAIIATFSTALSIFTVAALMRKARGGSLELPPGPLPQSDESATPAPPQDGRALPSNPVAGKVPTWFYQPTDLLGIGFIFLLFLSLVITSLRAPDPTGTLDSEALISAIGFQFIGAGIVTFFVITRVRPAEWLGLKWSSWPSVFLIAPGAVVLMWVVLAVFQISGFMDWINSLEVETVQDSVKLLQTSNDPRILGLMGFAAIVAAPLCEEVIFRGYLYPAAKSFTGTWAAGICSALVFAAAHSNLAALLPLFVFGCLLVVIYEKTGSIWAPIAAHCCFNTATVITQLVDRYHHLPSQSPS